LITFFFLSSIIIKCQDIRFLADQSQQNRNIEDSEIVRDVNGEICSMIVIKTSEKGIKFYSNRGIENIIYDSIRYFVWLPSDASVLRIVVPGFPLYEQTLEKRNDPFVYFFILQIPILEITTSFTEDTLKNKFTITSTPQKSKIFFKHEHIGNTPYTFNYENPDKDDYIEIRKFGYIAQSFRWDTLIPNNVYQIGLLKASRQKQFFVTASAGSLVHPLKPIIGLQLGRLKKVGYYVSGKIGTYHVDDPYEDLGHHTLFSVSAGMTVSVLPAIHTNFGLGWCYAILPDPGNEYSFDTIVDLIVDYGVILRTGKKGNILLWLQSNFRFDPSDWFTGGPYDISLGFGHTL